MWHNLGRRTYQNCFRDTALAAVCPVKLTNQQLAPLFPLNFEIRQSVKDAATWARMWGQSHRQVTFPIDVRASLPDPCITMPLMICSIVRWMARGTGLLIAAGFLTFVAGEPAASLRAIQFREWVGMVLLLGAVVGMLLAWRWELPSALISLFALVAFAAVVHMQNHVVLAIAAIPNILFLLDWKLRHLHSTPIAKAT